MLNKITDRIPLLLKVKSPISHLSDEQTGNIRLFRTMSIIDPNGDKKEIPIVSANSLRGILRRITARYLIEEIKRLQDFNVSPKLYHMLMSGGLLSKGESAGAHRINFTQDLRSLIPMIGLFGGTVQARIMAGTLRFSGPLYPVCRETDHLHNAPKKSDQARCLLESIFYTRRHDHGDDMILDVASADDGKDADQSQQMIFEGENIIPGAHLYSEIMIVRGSALEAGCLYNTLALWAEDPRLGGQSSKGHGLVEPLTIDGNPLGWTTDNAIKLRSEYVDHINSNHDAMAKMLKEISE